jgi:hypothetical protein
MTSLFGGICFANVDTPQQRKHVNSNHASLADILCCAATTFATFAHTQAPARWESPPSLEPLPAMCRRFRWVSSTLPLPDRVCRRRRRGSSVPHRCLRTEMTAPHRLPGMQLFAHAALYKVRLRSRSSLARSKARRQPRWCRPGPVRRPRPGCRPRPARHVCRWASASVRAGSGNGSGQGCGWCSHHFLSGRSERPPPPIGHFLRALFSGPSGAGRPAPLMSSGGEAAGHGVHTTVGGGAYAPDRPPEQPEVAWSRSGDRRRYRVGILGERPLLGVKSVRAPRPFSGSKL